MDIIGALLLELLHCNPLDVVHRCLEVEKKVWVAPFNFLAYWAGFGVHFFNVQCESAVPFVFLVLF